MTGRVRVAGTVNPAWDPLMEPTPPNTYWTTTNVGEAIPGVQTPLSWTYFREVTELTTRVASHAIGARPAREVVFPDRPEDRESCIFYGRAAVACSMLAMLGDRLPGTTGAETVASVLGTVPPDLEFRPTRRYYPTIAYKLPRAFLTLPRQLPGMVAEWDGWRRAQLARVPQLDQAQLAALVAESRLRHKEAVLLQTTLLFAVIQPLFDALSRVIEDAGTGDLSVLSGTGGAEMAVISDVWDASRGRRTIEQVIADHGFHGPHEGELSSRVWREDAAPLRALVERYAGRPDGDAPGRAEAEARTEWDRQRRAVLARLSLARRPGARLVLELARRRITLRGYAKRSFLGAFDVGRASARRLGELLADDGTLATPDDIWQLTLEEVTRGIPSNVRDVVAARGARHAKYKTYTLPSTFQGRPKPIPIAAGDGLRPGEQLTGIGVSAGVIEGVVRVVMDPSETDVADDEVLVAPVTDPSWSSLMFVSSALVVDIGGALSHAAVVARELGIPCVVNVRDATARLRTGDRVRVNGKAGTVEFLSAAEPA